MTPHRVFLTGGTGYIGSRLAAILAARGHDVTALARKESQHKLPPNCRVFLGNALDGDSYAAAVAGADTFIHLIGVSHPSPAKGRRFVEIDLKSAQEAVRVAAATAGICHFIYLSVAQPAPVMHAYIEVRKAGEQLLRASGLNATVLRPWYVLGPGHRWPYVLLPMYALAKLFPGMRASALRLEPVTLRQVLSALQAAVENPPAGIRVLEVSQLKASQRYLKF